MKYYKQIQTKVYNPYDNYIIGVYNETTYEYYNFSTKLSHTLSNTGIQNLLTNWYEITEEEAFLELI